MMNQTIEVHTIYNVTTFTSAFEAKKFIFNEAKDGVEEFVVKFLADEVEAYAEITDYTFDDDEERVDTWTGSSFITDAVKDPNI